MRYADGTGADRRRHPRYMQDRMNAGMGVLRQGTGADKATPINNSRMSIPTCGGEQDLMRSSRRWIMVYATSFGGQVDIVVKFVFQCGSLRIENGRSDAAEGAAWWPGCADEGVNDRSDMSWTGIGTCGKDSQAFPWASAADFKGDQLTVGCCRQSGSRL